MCITGEAGGFWDHFGAEKKKEKKTGSNIATSQRRDIRSTEEKSTNVSTSRRHKIAMSQRRNVATSSQFLPQNHKKQKRPNLEALKDVRIGVWKT